MIHNVFTWILLAALGRALVLIHPRIKNKDDLVGLVRVIKVVNDQQKKTVVGGGLYINTWW